MESQLPKDFELTEEFSNAFSLMENCDEPLYQCGVAGSGKSTLLQYFKENTKRKYVVLAPTGIAAINIGGQTIHSFFQFPIGLITPKDVRYAYGKSEVFNHIDTIIIDEVSMVRVDVMDAIDISLRINKKEPDRPFGGCKIILIGDLMQLSPIISKEEKPYFESRYNSPFFFDANVFKETGLIKNELKRIFRQTDETFISLLNKIRTNEIQYQELDIINQRHKEIEKSEKPFITIAFTNQIVSDINNKHLDELKTPAKVYNGILHGDFDINSVPTDVYMKLKVGAQIMMLRNDYPDRRWVNGTLGTVTELKQHTIKVDINGSIYEVEPAKWEKIDYDYDGDNVYGKVIGYFEQLPIKLAWSQTCHKAQGATLDNVIIDTGTGAFCHGQTYVALSRCKSLEGIYLKRKIKMSDIILDKRVLNFVNN